MKHIANMQRVAAITGLILAGALTGVTAQSDAMARAKAIVSADVLAVIHRRIALYTTFLERGPELPVRWTPRDIKLVDFVVSPSRTYANTNLYAFRYVVTLISDKQSLAINATSCQVAVVDKDGTYTDPAIGCEPPDLSHLLSAL